MPLIDPAKKAERQARRKERRKQIMQTVTNLLRELNELTDEAEEWISEKFGPGAPLNPDTDARDKMGK
jgi:DNA topoisomerase VI subunit B